MYDVLNAMKSRLTDKEMVRDNLYMSVAADIFATSGF